MREIDKYSIHKKKLQGICDKNGLTYTVQNKKYPFLMIIKPLGGIDAQQTMLEGMEDTTGTGYISPDASLVFVYRDGELAYKISETWTISENLFNKLKNLFKNMHSMWMQYFFREILEADFIPTSDIPAEPQDGENVTAEDENTSDAFDDFMTEAEPAEDEEDASGLVSEE